MKWAKAIAAGLVGVAAVCLAFLVYTALQRDGAAEAAAPADASVFVGDRADWLLDKGGIGVIDAATLPEIEARFTLSDGKMPGVGLRYYEGAKLWLRFTVPSLATDQERWVIKLANTRVREARLVVIRDGTIDEYEWRYDAPVNRAVLAGRIPAFEFDRAQIEGARVLLGFNSLGAMRGAVTVETERAFAATEWRQAALYSFLLGVMWALGVYLLVIGTRLGERSLVFAAGLSFTLGLFVYGVGGYVHAALLPQWPTLADVLLYGTQPWPPMFWMLLAIAYLDLHRRAPRVAGVLQTIALLLPFQGILTLFTALGFPVPFLTDNATPVLIGMLGGLAPVIWYALRGDRRAQGLLAAFTPVAIGSFLRVFTYLTPSPNPAFAAALDVYADMVVTVVLLAAVIVIDLQRREAALRQDAIRSETRLRAYAEIATDSYFETDGAGAVASAAGPLARELGLAEGAGLDETLRRMLADGAVLEQFAQVRRGGAGLAGLEAKAALDGREAWLSFNLVPLRRGDGSVGLRGTIADVTERVRRREGEARQATLSALGQLASGVAHEVNNLLHPMVNLAQRVRDKHTEDPEARKLLDLVVASGTHAGEIVAGVLNAFNPARPQGTRQPIGPALRQALEIVRPTLPATIELATQIGADATGPEVAPGAMLQVVSNLLSNAIRAMDGAGRIEMGLQRQGADIVLSVADDGPGMSEEVRRRATEPFFTGRRDGTGLGLSVVANIVRGWHGEMEIDSAPGAGTRIVIRLAGAAGGEKQT